MNTTAPIALFYGSSTCYTEMAGEKIREQLQSHLKALGKLSADQSNAVDVFNITDEPLATGLLYDYLIFGIPTWDYGELQEDWEEIWDDIDELDFSGKTIALYGLGDQIGYPEWFLDALGFLYHKLKKQGASLVGFWPIAGYSFEASKALSDDGEHFVGLALDDENEFEKSPARIQSWCEQIVQEFGL
ncbi:flavodoxin FldB [Teredinibacter waterburyi]|uniref:flavodoxin FldB n=1 Tax=Teredinibacter waterburyi TaxID=1500538 RepID=UPI00165F3E1B|nr:flavodoxin FldB [Teredinibacter waterburyi]